MSTEAPLVGVPSFPARAWRQLGLVLGLALLSTLPFQGSRGLFESTEGRYAECARETLATGDWDDPILQGLPHWTKPPLTYMAIMPGIRLFGNNPWGARGFLVVAMLLSVGAVWLAGASIWGPEAGFWSAMVFVSSPLAALAAHVVSADLLTTLWVALATAAFWYGYMRQAPFAFLAVWLFLGMGLLTKGPPAILVPGVSLLVAACGMARHRFWQPGAWLLGTGLVMLAVLGFSWYVTEGRETPGLFSYWIGQELVARNLRDTMHRNPGFAYAWEVYLPLLLLGTGPWLVMVLWKGRPWSDWFRNDTIQWQWHQIARQSLLGGVVVPFAVFSLSKSKLPLYLVPLLVPLSLILGRMLETLLAQQRLRKRTVQAWVAALLALFVVLKGAAGFIEHPMDMTRLAATLEDRIPSHPDFPLYSVGSKPLHGLEFQTGRLIDNIPAENLFAHMASGQVQPPSARYLIRKKKWDKLAGAAPLPVLAEPLGKYWLLVRAAEAPARRSERQAE